MKVTRKEIFPTRFNLSKSKVYLQNTQEFIIHKEKSNNMQQCIKILLFHIYMKLDMFRATHRPSSGA